MFSFRPNRAAAVLLELADAMLAPPTLLDGGADDLRCADDAAFTAAHAHPHRRAAVIERRRRPAPPRQAQPCIAPVTRAVRAGDAARRTDASSRS
jgi:hypothetical protein